MARNALGSLGFVRDFLRAFITDEICGRAIVPQTSAIGRDSDGDANSRPEHSQHQSRLLLVLSVCRSANCAFVINIFCQITRMETKHEKASPRLITGDARHADLPFSVLNRNNLPRASIAIVASVVASIV